MKKVLFILLLLTATAATFAQTEKYIKAMESKVALIDSTRGTDAWKNLTASFERIADAEKTQWLAYYYAALGHIMTGYSYTEGNTTGGMADKTDPEADLAETMLNKAIGLSKENSETWVLKKMIATLRMMADPMSRYMTYGPAAAEALEKAKAMDANNPRTYLLEGQDKFFTPEQFGGSKEQAKILFEDSKKKYESFKPESSIHPTWGKSQVYYFLSQTK
jgi:hypothetical protein